MIREEEEEEEEEKERRGNCSQPGDIFSSQREKRFNSVSSYYSRSLEISGDVTSVSWLCCKLKKFGKVVRGKDR